MNTITSYATLPVRPEKVILLLPAVEIAADTPFGLKSVVDATITSLARTNDSPASVRLIK